MSKFVIYGRPGCPWCEKAIHFLVARGKPIEYINVRENDANMANFRVHFPHATTVPQIMYLHNDYFEARYIGGYTDLEKWYNENYEEGSDI